MSEAESRSGNHEDINTRDDDDVLDISNGRDPVQLVAHPAEWTSSRTRPVQLGQGLQPSASSRKRPTDSSSVQSPDNCCGQSATSRRSGCHSPIPSPPQHAIIASPPQCTENKSASPKSNQFSSSATSTTTHNNKYSAKNESSKSVDVSVVADNKLYVDDQDATAKKSATNHPSATKKNQEIANGADGKNIRLPDIKNPKAPHRSRKASGIPVGKVGPWQRLVTSANSMSTPTTSSTMSSTTRTTTSLTPVSPSPPIKSPSLLTNHHKLKVPQRPSSASPILPKSSSSSSSSSKEEKGNRSCKSNVTNDNRHSATELTVTSRPLPSSSVPPSTAHLHANRLANFFDHQFPYGATNGYGTHPPQHHSHIHGNYADWQSNLMLPHHLSQQGYNAAASMYMQQQQQQQQLSLQQQLQLTSHQYGYPVSPYMYGGYPAESLHQFEQFLHQQQQSDLLRHHQQQQQQQQLLLRHQADYDIQRPTPIPSPSHRLSIPVASPSPTTASLLNSPSLSLSNHPAATTSLPTNWSDLYHHNSSAALSPKSLTSSTPSPVTVHDFNLGFNITLNRKCATPNSLSSATITTINNSHASSLCGNPGSKNFPFNSPFSPSLFPSKDVWKNVKISPAPMKRRKYSPRPDSKDRMDSKEHFSSTNGNSDKASGGKFCASDRQEEEPVVVVKVEPGESDLDMDGEEPTTAVKLAGNEADDLDFNVIGNVQQSASRKQCLLQQQQPLPLKIFTKKHDFKRLESLIEKRADESVHLLTQSTSYSSSSEDSEVDSTMMTTQPKKAKLDLTAEERCENESRLISSLATNSSKSRVLETEDESQRFAKREAAATRGLVVKIKKEVDEKYNDTCQNSETFPTQIQPVIMEEKHTFSIKSPDIECLNFKTGPLNDNNLTLTKSVVGTAAAAAAAAGEDRYLDTELKHLTDVKTCELVSALKGTPELPKMDSVSTLELCNELKTHDDCDFDCVDGGVSGGEKVVPESNIPFSNRCKENNNNHNNSRSNPVVGVQSSSDNSNSLLSLKSSNKETKWNDSSKILNVPVEKGATTCKDIAARDYTENYFESTATANSGSPPSPGTNVYGIVVKQKIKEEKAEYEETNSFNSNSSVIPNATEEPFSEDTSETEGFIRIKDDKCYLEDEEDEEEEEEEEEVRGGDDSTDFPNNQYTTINNNNVSDNHISVYSSQSERFGCRSPSSSMMTSESDLATSSSCHVTAAKVNTCPAEQMTNANQYSFNINNKIQVGPVSISQNGITPEDFSLNPHLISLNESDGGGITGVHHAPDAAAVNSSDHPPVTLYVPHHHILPVNIISPQNIKIPLYVPSAGTASYMESSSDGGSSIVGGGGERKFTTTVLYQQQAPEPFSMYSYGSPLASPPLCDKDIGSGDDNIVQIRQPRILPIENQTTMQIRRNSFFISPDACIKPEDNHLDLLATVAQEFGRSDLGKVSNCLSMGSSTTCLNSPTSLQSIANTISTSNSIYTAGDILQPIPAIGNVAPETVDAPPPTATEPVADLFEFRCEDEDACLQSKLKETKGYIPLTKKPLKSENKLQQQNLTPYQPVLLKIPQIVPKAAAEKLKKAKLRQEKAKERNLEKKKVSKKVSLKVPGPMQIFPNTKGKVNNTNRGTVQRKSAEGKLNEKLKIPKIKKTVVKQLNIVKSVPSTVDQKEPVHIPKIKKTIGKELKIALSVPAPIDQKEPVQITKTKKTNGKELKIAKSSPLFPTAVDQKEPVPIDRVKSPKKEKSESVIDHDNKIIIKKKKKLPASGANLVTDPQLQKIPPVVKPPALEKVKPVKPKLALKTDLLNTEAEKLKPPKQKQLTGPADKLKEPKKPNIKLLKSDVNTSKEAGNVSVKKSLKNLDLNKSKQPKDKDTQTLKNIIAKRSKGSLMMGDTVVACKPKKSAKVSEGKKKMSNGHSKSSTDKDSLPSNHQQLPAISKAVKIAPMLSPSNVENEMRETIENSNLTDRENEYDWEVSPTYAVTAIKLMDTNLSNSATCDSDVSVDCNKDKSEKKDNKRKSSKPSKLTLLSLNNRTQSESNEREKILKVKTQLKSFVHFAPRRIKNGHNSNGGPGTVLNRRHSSSSTSSSRHIKPCLKAEPIMRPMTDKEDSEDSDIDLEVATLTRSISSSAIGSNSHNSNQRGSNNNLRKKPPTNNKEGLSNVFTFETNKSRIESTSASSSSSTKGQTKNLSTSAGTEEEGGKPEKRGRRTSSAASAAPAPTPKPPSSIVNEKVVIENVAEMLDEMRILTEIQGLFYTGKLNALQPPDVYGVTLDNERGAPPHIIFSAEEVLEKCIREVKPYQLKSGLRICAYWSPQYSGLYPGKVSLDYNPSSDPDSDLVPIEFDDGDTGVIKVGEIRLLASNHPIREYDPNPLLTLEKKHRKRRHSSTNGLSGNCTGDHEDADCGEPYCAKLAKLEEEEKEESRSSKVLYWTWTGLGYKIPKTKKYRHKEFFRGIQRGDEVINVGDSALFISNGNDRPFIGQVERFFEKKGKKIVNVKWFYHPEEVETGKRLHGMKYAGALFESPHIDENDVQTIAKKCEVLPFKEFKEKVGGLPKLSKNASPKDIYYIAGFYNPYTFKLKINDLK